MDLYNWKEINFPWNKQDWKNFELNKKSIVLILYVPHNTEKKRHAYKSKYNLKRGNQVILLMITDGKNWHYLAIKKLSALLRGIISNHKDNFYCLNCFHSYTTKNKLEKRYDICKNQDCCYVEMPEKDSKILKYDH